MLNLNEIHKKLIFELYTTHLMYIELILNLCGTCLKFMSKSYINDIKFIYNLIVFRKAISKHYYIYTYYLYKLHTKII